MSKTKNTIWGQMATELETQRLGDLIWVAKAVTQNNGAQQLFWAGRQMGQKYPKSGEMLPVDLPDLAQISP